VAEVATGVVDAVAETEAEIIVENAAEPIIASARELLTTDDPTRRQGGFI
jgi:hypothetical protein